MNSLIKRWERARERTRSEISRAREERKRFLDRGTDSPTHLTQVRNLTLKLKLIEKFLKELNDAKLM